MLLQNSGWTCLFFLPCAAFASAYWPGIITKHLFFSVKNRTDDSNVRPSSTRIKKENMEALGPACTHLGRRCLSNAECIFDQKQCVCPAETPVGDGLMECAEKDKMVCRVECDPKIYTWNLAKAPINLPCWYCVTKFLAPIYPTPRDSTYKWCKVQVLALNTLTKDGLFFVGAVKVNLWLAGLVSNTYTLHLDSHKTFEVCSGKAKQSIHTRENPWEEWTRKLSWWQYNDAFKDLFDKFSVLTSWQSADRFAILNIAPCGVKIKYRPAGHYQPQVLKPGLVVTIPRSDNIKFHKPSFMYVCQTHKDDVDTFTRDAARWKLNNPGQLLLFYTLLQNGVTGKSHPFQGQCRKARGYLQHKNCQDDRYLAIQLCGPILNLHEHFIKCLGLDLVMSVFEKCVSWACLGKAGGRVFDCVWYLKTIDQCGCHKTSLMKAIECNDQARVYYRDQIYKPSYHISTIIGY